MDTTYAKVIGDRVECNVENVAEAKIALKELKLLKKEYGIQKRLIADNQKAIRAQYTDQTRRQGSVMRGGGGIGKFVRSMQSASRDTQRANLAKALAPYEKQKQQVEAIMLTIDKVILNVESFIATGKA